MDRRVLTQDPTCQVCALLSEVEGTDPTTWNVARVLGNDMSVKLK